MNAAAPLAAGACCTGCARPLHRSTLRDGLCGSCRSLVANGRALPKPAGEHAIAAAFREWVTR